MIRYALRCNAISQETSAHPAGPHGFEAWFRSSEDFDAQSARGLISCPICGGTDISKALMAPQIARGGANEPQTMAEEEAAPPAASAPPVPLPPISPGVMETLRSFREEVLSKTEDLGDGFVEEARKIHYGEAEARGIRGQATLEDARDLIEEGIEVMPVPVLPEDFN